MTLRPVRPALVGLSVILIFGMSPLSGASASPNAPTTPASPTPVAIGALAMAAPASAIASQARPHASHSCARGLCLFFAGIDASGTTSTGASVKLSQARPKVGAHDLYSGASLAVGSADGRQGILFGWVVAKRLFGDTFPHLVLNAVRDGVALCLNECGFKSATKVPRAGTRVTVGRVGTYTIKLTKNRWVLAYNTKVIGYFPTAVWHGKLNRSHLVQAYGTVASSSPTSPHSQMGNGQLGTLPRSAKLIGLKVIGSIGTPGYSYQAVDAPNTYKVGRYNATCASACSSNYGGPGF